jgi:hypothetical protein
MTGAACARASPSLAAAEAIYVFTRTRYVSVVEPSGGTRSVHVAVDADDFTKGADVASIVQSPGIGSTTSTVSGVFLALLNTIWYALT